MNSDQELKVLCEEYAAELPKKIAAIKSEWNELREKNDNERFK